MIKPMSIDILKYENIHFIFLNYLLSNQHLNLYRPKDQFALLNICSRSLKGSYVLYSLQ